MANLAITEYTRFGRDDRGVAVPAGQEPAIETKNVAISGTPAFSARLSEGARVAELHCDVKCHVKFSLEKNSTAATTSMKPMPANATQFFSLVPGLVVSVIEGV